MLNCIISHFQVAFFFTVARDSNHMRWYWNGAVCGGLPHRIFTVPRPEHARKPVNWKKNEKLEKKRSDFNENRWESVHTWSGPVKTCCRLSKSTPRRPQIIDFLLFFSVFRTIFHHFFDIFWAPHFFRFWCQLGSNLAPQIHPNRNKNQSWKASIFQLIFALI